MNFARSAEAGCFAADRRSVGRQEVGLVDLTDSTSPPDLAAEFRAHYIKFWSSASNRSPVLPTAEIQKRIAALAHDLARTQDALIALGIPPEVDAIAFVGHGRSNGHAVVLGERVFAWFALERYGTPLFSKSFVPHEVAHSIHYKNVPDFYFSTTDEQQMTGRQVVTEGLATRISEQVGRLEPADAIWADALGPGERSAWMRSARQDLAGLARSALQSWHAAVPGNPLFTFSPGSEPAQNRGGYFLGLEATRLLEKEVPTTVAELIFQDRPQVESLYIDVLRRLAAQQADAADEPPSA